MAASENLRRELESIEARIEELREDLHRLDADFRMVRGRAGWLWALRVRAMRVGLGRQVRELELRRGAARTCLVETEGYEEWLRFSALRERPETLVGC